jgi:hypothetical protein
MFVHRAIWKYQNIYLCKDETTEGSASRCYKIKGDSYTGIQEGFFDI